MVRGICLTAIAATCAFAQDLKFEATVTGTIVAGQQFQLSFTATSSRSLTLSKFSPPEFQGLVVLSGPMESSQYQWINGRASSSLSYVYVLLAQKPGTYTIGRGSVEYEGKQYSTTPLTISVAKAPAGASGPAAQGTLASSLRDNLFVRATANRQRVKQGEQFVITYKLYWSQIGLENYIVSKAPTFEGFWAEDFELPRSPELSQEVIDGKQYRSAVFKRTALFATQPGKLGISPLEVRCAVQVRRRPSEPFDIFNDPFFSRLRTEEVEITSNALSVAVDPLPGTAPKEFEGAVGRFEFNAAVDRRDVRAGDPVTLTLTVSGAGNLRLVRIPRPAFSTDIEAYEPKISETISREGTVIKGRKSAEYLLIPRNPGERAIEPVTFIYFDLEKNAYVPLRSPRFALSVTPGKEPAPGTSLASKEEIRLLGEDIRFLKLDPGDFEGEDERGLGGWFTIGVIVPSLLFAGSYAYRKRQEALLGQGSLIRAQKAGREASRRLRSAKKILARGDTESYHAEISRALYGYVGDKLRIPPANLSLDSVVNALRGREVDSEAIGRLHSCLEKAEFARFAPGRDSREARLDLLEGAIAAIEAIEKSLNGR